MACEVYATESGTDGFITPDSVTTNCRSMAGRTPVITEATKRSDILPAAVNLDEVSSNRHPHTDAPLTRGLVGKYFGSQSALAWTNAGVAAPRNSAATAMKARSNTFLSSTIIQDAAFPEIAHVHTTHQLNGRVSYSCLTVSPAPDYPLTMKGNTEMSPVGEPEPRDLGVLEGGVCSGIENAKDLNKPEPDDHEGQGRTLRSEMSPVSEGDMGRRAGTEGGLEVREGT